MSSTEKPNHHDAELVLKLYELRREAVMRESRSTMLGKFWPKNYDEFLAVTDIQHPMNAAFRQTTSYWEMAYSFARHGIIDADFLAENAGEGLFLFGKIKPYLEQFRKESSPTAFTNTEWLIQNSEFAKKRMTMIEARIQKMQQAAPKS